MSPRWKRRRARRCRTGLGLYRRRAGAAERQPRRPDALRIVPRMAIGCSSRDLSATLFAASWLRRS
jgi:hypothetical protein